MKRFSNKSSSNINESKRQRVGSVESCNPNAPTDAPAFDDSDPFGDDDFTADDLIQIDRFATQVESKADKKRDVNAERSKCPRKIVNHFVSPKNSVSNSSRNSELKDLQKKLDHYQKKVAELELSHSRKDGETKILRDRLGKSEKEKLEQKMKLINIQQIKEREKSEKEEVLEKELESVRGQMEFKEAEILESQNLIRTLEQKNKMLLKNHQIHSSPKDNSSGTSGSAIKRPISEFKDWDMQPTQEIAGSAKRIKIVKPKPTSSINRRNSAGKHDDAKPKISPRKMVLSKTVAGNSNLDKSNFILKSKLLSRATSVCSDLLKVQIVDNEAVPSIPLLTCLQGEDTVIDDARPSSFNTTSHKNYMKSAIQGLQNLSVTASTKNSIGGTTNTDIQHYIQLLPIVQSALAQYIKLCQMILPPKDNKNSAEAKQPTPAITEEQICSSTEKVVAGLQMLKTIVEHVPTVTNVLIKKESKEKSNSIVENMRLLCSAKYWCSRLPSCYDITTTALSVLVLLLKSCTNDDFISQKFLINETAVCTMLQCELVQLKCNLFDVLHSSLHFRGYAELLANGGPKSVVFRVCELYRQRQPPVTSESTWLKFLTKAIRLMTLYITKHNDVLLKHQCYAEIYHASDVMLYNQLNSRKTDIVKNTKRDQVISHALWVLHSCTTVYADGIPDSRREHKHQMVLLMLEKFHNETADDQTSFWHQELKRVLKSEVKNLYEESNIA